MVALWTWQIIQITLNVVGHLGYELYPSGFNKHWFFRFKTVGTHHNMHHEKVHGNYGLYFIWWDIFFKTEFENYESTFEGIHQKIQETKSAETSTNRVGLNQMSKSSASI